MEEDQSGHTRTNKHSHKSALVAYSSPIFLMSNSVNKIMQRAKGEQNLFLIPFVFCFNEGPRDIHLCFCNFLFQQPSLPTINTFHSHSFELNIYGITFTSGGFVDLGTCHYTSTTLP